MIIAVLIVLGLCMGSFVNALVWRLHEQAAEVGKKKPDQQYLQRLSISRGRSMCSHCHHELTALDLIPVVSWLVLRGKCRYCDHPIPDTPLPELGTSLLFVLSYIYWPQELAGIEYAVFGLWLVLLVSFMALIVYDARWMLLPSKVIYPTGAVAALLAALEVASASNPARAVLYTALSIGLGGGIFWLIYKISDGKWIGYGDVRLGWIFGAVVGAPQYSVMVIFFASLLGCVVALPFVFSKRLKGSSLIPFGPFLIVATIIVKLFGVSILHWYEHVLLLS